MRSSVLFRLVVMPAFACAFGSAIARPVAAADANGGLPAQAAIPVQQVLNPVAFTLCTAEGAGAVEKCEAFGNPPTYQVPSGRRLIIEQVSGDCGSDDDSGKPLRAMIVARTKGAVLEHALIGVPRPNNFGGYIPLTLVRIYGDPNSSITIDLTGVPAFGDRFCRVTFSGQLVKP